MAAHITIIWKNRWFHNEQFPAALKHPTQLTTAINEDNATKTNTTLQKKLVRVSAKQFHQPSTMRIERDSVMVANSWAIGEQRVKFGSRAQEVTRGLPSYIPTQEQAGQENKYYVAHIYRRANFFVTEFKH